MTRVSVIIPVYNAAKYLKDCVLSVLTQEHVGEILLVEDGSSDGSLKISTELAKEYDNVSLVIHENNINRGPGITRNVGIEKATEEFIAFLDADDYYLENRFHEDVKKLGADKSLDGIYHSVEVISESKEEDETAEHNLIAVTKLIAPLDLATSMSPIGIHGFFHLNGLTIRKTAVQGIDCFDPDLTLAQDTEFLIRLAALRKLVGSDSEKPVAIHRRHPANRSKDKDAYVNTYWPVMYEKLLAWAVSERTSKKLKRCIWRRTYYYSFRGKSSSLKTYIFLMRSFFSYPFLRFWRGYYCEIPILGRLLGKYVMK